MGKTIASFLVGLGFDFDKESAREADSAIDGVKSSALQLGAVLAGAFGVKSLTADFADMADSVGKFTQVFGGLPGDITALGRALEHEGAADGLAAIQQQLSGIERLRAGLSQGNAEWIAVAGRAGIDTSEIIAATSATEAYIALADQFQNMTRQQRINAADALGLDEASIRLLSQGSNAVRDLVESEKQARPLTEEMTQTAAEFNKQWQNINTNIGGFADTASNTLLPAINNVLAGMNGWVDVNREFINQGIGAALKPVADNLELVAIGATALGTSGLLKTLAGMARFIPVIGGGLATAAAAANRLVWPVAVLAAAAEAWDWDAEDLQNKLGLSDDMAKFLTTPIGDLISGTGSTPESVPLTPPDVVSESVTPTSPEDGGVMPMLPGSLPGIPGPARPDTRVVIENKTYLDGQVIDRRIRDVTEQINDETLQDLRTSTGG